MIMPNKAEKCYSYIEVLKDLPNFKERTQLHFDILRIKNTGNFEMYSQEEMSMITDLQTGKF